jgi:hypothetical protein
MTLGAAPDLLCQQWLLEHSYILCSTELFGFPMLYASSGFTELFGVSSASSARKKCGAVVGVQAIRAHDPTLTACMHASGLEKEQVQQALDYLQAQSLRQVQEMMNGGTGSLITLNRTLAGRFLVVSVVMHQLRHPESGRSYAIGLQREVTDSISVEEIFKKAFHCEDIVVETGIEFVRNCLSLLQRSDVSAFLHRKIEDAWYADAADEYSRISKRPSIDSAKVAEEAGIRSMPLPDFGSDTASVASHARSLPSRRGMTHRLTSLVPSRTSGPTSIEQTYMEQLVSDGYKAGDKIASSRWNRSARIFRARKHGELFAVKCVDETSDYKAIQQLTNNSMY